VKVLSIQMSEGKFEHQTAGHEGSILKKGTDKLMKPVAANEISFYEGFYKQFPNMHPHLPIYYGHEKRDDKTYIILEDLTSKFKKPCIMDIKMGTSSVGEDATPEKKASMGAKDAKTTTTKIGIRLSGLRVYHPTKSAYEVRDKDFGKKVKEETFLDALRLFFSNGETTRKQAVLDALRVLRRIKEYISNQKDLRFYSSSLLFIYEGDDIEGNHSGMDIRMIDFAHVHPIHDGGRDEGYIFGLTHLLGLMETLSK